MKGEKSILIAFMLNLSFSAFELIGGAFTGSIAIISDAMHDLRDALSIGLSYFLEKKSKKEPDETFTYGYKRYSLLGGFITTMILLAGSVIVVCGAIVRLINPTEINYDGMIVFAVVGVIVNFAAAYFTHGGSSINQRAVNLHMLEDVLGWLVVLIGGIVMRFTDFYFIDSLMSIGVACFIFVVSLKNLREISNIFLEKIPEGISKEKIEETLNKIEGVKGFHHLHLRSIDGRDIYLTLHLVAENYSHELKDEVKHRLKEIGISHVTVEIELESEHCNDELCRVECSASHGHNH